MANTLFTPFSVRGLTLQNRIVMAPMTRAFSPGGVPGANVAAYYKRRAESDVGLILTEGTVIDRAGSSNDPNYPKFYGCLLYTSPSPRDLSTSRMPSSA